MGELGQAEIKVKLDSQEADAELDRLEARVDRVVAKLQAFQAEDDARVLDLVKRGIRCGWNEHQTDRSIGSLAHDLDQMARGIIAKANRDQGAESADDCAMAENLSSGLPCAGEVWRDKIRTLRGNRCHTLIVEVWPTLSLVTHTTPSGNYSSLLPDFLRDHERVTGPAV